MTECADKKKLPVGIESFTKIRKENFYYIDKTFILRDLLKNWAEVNLFTRPRRFGKSLNMSMLQAFFEIGTDPTLFDGLSISRESRLCREYMGKFPVISVSLKSVSGIDYSAARSLLCSVIGNEAARFESLLLGSSVLTETDKERYRMLLRLAISMGDSLISDAVLTGSLKTLCTLLHKHYGQKVILIIDEYDVPLAKADESDYYDQMVFLIRSLFDQALKTNDSLYFAVLTGCLRISKESIFTGLNNVKVLSITDVQFDEYFGFTDKEVREMLAYYEIPETYEDVKKWYDGYRFGNVEVYCPWDVISYCDKRKDDPLLFPESYWSNTSSNSIIRRLLEKATAVTRSEIERLIAGESIIKEVRSELTYKEIYDSVDNVWSVLFTTGYLTLDSIPDRRNASVLRLRIPNEEIRGIYLSQIQEWMQEVARRDRSCLERFCNAFKEQDAVTVEQILCSYLEKTISIRDTATRSDLKENFYHGFLLGLLRSREDWLVLSNRETGEGYSDIIIEIFPEKIGIVIELKYAGENSLEHECRAGLDQINAKDYTAALRCDGMQKILKYGIAFRYKQCRVMTEQHPKI